MRDVLRAAAIVDRAGFDPEDRDRFRAPVLEAALDLQRAHPDTVGLDTPVFDVPCTEHSLRAALEATYRSMARHAPTRAERIDLVDRANSIRPRSLL
jgi:serine/threonine-protein kinase PknG